MPEEKEKQSSLFVKQLMKDLKEARHAATTYWFALRAISSIDQEIIVPKKIHEESVKYLWLLDSRNLRSKDLFVDAVKKYIPDQAKT